MTCYEGAIRSGSKKNAVISVVKRCTECGVERLAESACKNHSDYIGTDYREELNQSHDRVSYYQSAKEMINYNLKFLQEFDLLDKKFVDVGCAGGIALDAVSGLANQVVGIEPNVQFGSELTKRGIEWFQSTEDALSKYEGVFDFAFSSQVIEHVIDPGNFMAGVFHLLKPGGIAFISTPNRHDILMDIAYSAFAPHFYRTQHRWMFSCDSLGECCKNVGFDILNKLFIHRYSLVNAITWCGGGGSDLLQSKLMQDKTLDIFWKTWVESAGKSDNIAVVARKPTL